jgi:hypothetical protein
MKEATMRKHKNIFDVVRSKLGVSNKDSSEEGKHHHIVNSPKSVSGIWPFLILFGLLLTVMLIQWLRTSN